MITLARRGLRRVLYDLRGGFLIRPLAVAAVLGASGIALTLTEQRWAVLDTWASQLPVLASHDAATAQAVLSTVASAVMTVLSIVLSVLLVALTLASVQFSPRILTGFVHDRISQHTIGLFLGTFLCCLAAYPAVHTGRDANVPALAVLGAMLLAFACVASLLRFVQHIARSINANYITDRIADETERTIDAVMPSSLAAPHEPEPPPERDAVVVVLAATSGYIRFIDTARLVALAKARGTSVRVLRRVGQFVAASAPLVRVATRQGVSDALRDALLAAFDIGPVRTLEQDVEFGVLELVDIALEAISPAVDDPSTAINCVDQLSRRLARVAARRPAVAAFYQPPGVLRVALAPLPFAAVLETAFGQIRHYGRTDLAVSLRLLRALSDVASVAREPSYRAALSAQAQRVVRACEGQFAAEDQAKIDARLTAVVQQLEAVGDAVESSA